MYILSQILVVLSDLACIVSMMNKKKKNVVFFLIISTILFASHYMCLGAWTGAAIGFVELVFLILMHILEIKDKTQYSTYLSIGTMIITVALFIITWDTWISLLPMLAMVIYLTAMMFKNVIIVKVRNIYKINVKRNIYAFTEILLWSRTKYFNPCGHNSRNSKRL